MPDRDIQDEVGQILWDRMWAHTPLVEDIPEGNRFWLGDPSYEGEDHTDEFEIADGDADRLEMWCSAGSDDLRVSSDETFGSYTPEGCADWINRISLTFRILITTPFRSQKGASKTASHVVTALKKAGYKLGTDYVTSATVRWSTRRESRQEDSTVRWIHEMELQIGCELPGSTMKGDPDE